MIGIQQLEKFNAGKRMMQYEGVVSAFSSYVRKLNENEQDFVISLSSDEIKDLIANVKEIDPHVCDDLVAQLNVQKRYLCLEEEHSALFKDQWGEPYSSDEKEQRYCWTEMEGNAKEKRFTAANSVLKDLAKLTTSVVEFWNDLHTSNEMDTLVNILGVTGEREAGFGRVCQFAEVLSDLKLIDEQFSYDELAESLAARVSDDGYLTKKRRRED